MTSVYTAHPQPRHETGPRQCSWRQEEVGKNTVGNPKFLQQGDKHILSVADTLAENFGAFCAVFYTLFAAGGEFQPFLRFVLLNIQERKIRLNRVF